MLLVEVGALSFAFKGAYLDLIAIGNVAGGFLNEQTRILGRPRIRQVRAR